MLRYGSMNIIISNRKLKRTIEDDHERVKRFGLEMAKKIRLRMGALLAAESLADFWPPYSGPERCHELKGNLSGVFSLDLKQPYRLLLKATDTEIEWLDDKSYWQSIKSIEILSIEDTHE